MSSEKFTVSEAFFESMSGITTTGATIITNLESTPKSILLWRALMQWLGDWYCCYGYYYFASSQGWWYATF